MEKPQNIIRNLKRHSDGTFASDFTHYLDKIKAKDFVEWLASTKQEGQAVKTYTFILKLCVLWWCERKVTPMLKLQHMF